MCAICHETLGERPTLWSETVVPCRTSKMHRFHRSCIDQVSSGRCPSCNTANSLLERKEWGSPQRTYSVDVGSVRVLTKTENENEA
jgi:hypothetical protein